MLPRWHIIFGAVFTAIIYFFSPEINLFYLLVVFLASFLIDFDHYINAIIKTRNVSLFKAFEYYKELDKINTKEKFKGIRKRGDFHLFHTMEFHLIIGLIGIFIPLFFYIFIGFIFHSLLDVISLIYGDRIYLREFFFFRWVYERVR